MSEPTNGYPTDWLAQDYNPRDHLMQYERTNRRTGEITKSDYLRIPDRTMWFIRDQRQLISAGLAKTTYLIQTEMIELDRVKGYALFKTFVRDVLGNESTDFGSEEAKDFSDYIEKAATKSRGRALAGLGYGTQYALDCEEGVVCDSPVQRNGSAPRVNNSARQQNTLTGEATLGQVRTYLNKNGMPTSEAQDSFLRSMLHIGADVKIPMRFTAEQTATIVAAVTTVNANKQEAM